MDYPKTITKAKVWVSNHIEGESIASSGAQCPACDAYFPFRTQLEHCPKCKGFGLHSCGTPYTVDTLRTDLSPFEQNAMLHRGEELHTRICKACNYRPDVTHERLNVYAEGAALIGVCESKAPLKYVPRATSPVMKSQQPSATEECAKYCSDLAISLRQHIYDDITSRSYGCPVALEASVRGLLMDAEREGWIFSFDTDTIKVSDTGVVTYKFQPLAYGDWEEGAVKAEIAPQDEVKEPVNASGTMDIKEGDWVLDKHGHWHHVASVNPAEVYFTTYLTGVPKPHKDGCVSHRRMGDYAVEVRSPGNLEAGDVVRSVKDAVAEVVLPWDGGVRVGSPSQGTWNWPRKVVSSLVMPNAMRKAGWDYDFDKQEIVFKGSNNE